MTPLELIWPADPLKVAAPLSPAVTCGNRLRVPGIPADDANGRLAVGEFTARMTPVMANLTGILQAAGADGRRVKKVNVFQTRRADFAEMNRLDAAHLPDGKCPARTACIVSSLPQPNLLLAIEGAAVPG